MATETATPPRTMADLNRVIKHDMTPDPDWEETGEFHRDTAGNRFPVYKILVPVMAKREKTGPDGQIVWHLRPDGTRHRPMMEEVEVRQEYVEFINIPVGNGITQKNFHFRPSEAEIAKRQLLQEELKAGQELQAALRTLGMKASDLVAAAKQAVGVEARPESGEEATPAEPIAPAGGKRSRSSPSTERSL